MVDSGQTNKAGSMVNGLPIFHVAGSLLLESNDPNFPLPGWLDSFQCEPAPFWLSLRCLQKRSSCPQIPAAARHRAQIDGLANECSQPQ